jgi:hypothetical protein
MQGELAFPVGHPAHPDYTGAPWKNPGAVFDEDFAVGHPARAGANVRVIDTPDGQRAAHLQHSQDLQQLAAMGSLPPLVDDETGEKIDLTPEQLAHVYAVRNGLQPPLAAEVTQRYGLSAQSARVDEIAVLQPTAEECALAHIIGLGYTPERAREVLAKYGVPEIQADQRADANR